MDLFKLHVGIDLRQHQTQASLAEVVRSKGLTTHATDTWDDLYFKLWLNCVEPNLPKDRPTFVTHYPVSQSSLCNRIQDETGFEWANRFELYVGQCELGNAFDELRDPRRQRANFEHDQRVRQQAYGNEWPQSPIDEPLIECLNQIPPVCGIALGVDRLAMVVLGANELKELIALEPHW
jgi:lysyl-tRNA synthetase class 2